MTFTEFDQLLAHYLEADASEEQIAQLTQAIQQNRAFAEYAQQQLKVHANLSVLEENEFNREKFLQTTASGVARADEDIFSDAVIEKLTRWRWTKRITAIAAVLVLGAFSYLLIQPFFEQSPTPGQMQGIASLSRTDGVQWNGKPLDHGAAITAGSSIDISAGLLEIDLDGRGSLVIEGPAKMDFNSGVESVIHRGSVVMRATKKGHGYTIKTPKGKVVDLGTEFAISVDEQNEVETHVIDGSVEAVSNNGQKITLLQNDALRFDDEGGTSIHADLGRFYTAMPPVAEDGKFLHWSMDEGTGNLAKAVGKLGAEQSQIRDLIFHAVDEGSSPQWVQAMKGSGIYLDGNGAYAQSNYRGISGGKARSVCFWLKVPKDFNEKQGFGIVSWGDPTRLGETWQISVNPMSQSGDIGRLRLGLHGGQIVGSTDLRDGEWHHIAVVLYGGSMPNIGTHALLYIDGKKESVSRASLREVKTNVHNSSHGVWVGRNVTYKETTGKHENGRFFRGGIDELYIFDTALSQQEVQRLMER